MRGFVQIRQFVKEWNKKLIDNLPINDQFSNNDLIVGQEFEFFCDNHVLDVELVHKDILLIIVEDFLQSESF